MQKVRFNLSNFLNSIFSNELPVYANMDAYLDYILPYIRPYSEDLAEKKFFINKRWKEFRDDEDFHEAVLYIFQNDEGELLLSIDGNIGNGGWQILENSNTMIIEGGGKKQKSELFDLAFLNKEFFILRKHGNQKRIDKKKYLVLALEKSNGNLDYPDLMEKMFDVYRKNWLYTVTVIFLLVFVGLILFSIFM